MHKKKEALEPKTALEKQLLKKVTDAMHKDEIPGKAKKMFYANTLFLKQPFSFYSFGVKINEENCEDIASQVYPRQLEAQIMDLVVEKDVTMNEL